MRTGATNLQKLPRLQPNWRAKTDFDQKYNHSTIVNY